MRTPSGFDTATYVGTVVIGVALIVIARWAGRRRGTRWDMLLALRIGDVLLTEVLGMFLIGYGVGSLVAAQTERGTPVGPGPGGGRFVGFRGFGGGDQLPFTLGLVGAAIAILMRVDLRDLLLGGRSTRDPLVSYIGWDARVVAPIPAGGFGEIALRDGNGNIMSVSATADVEIPADARVRVTGTRDLNLLVAPIGPG